MRGLEDGPGWLLPENLAPGRAPAAGHGRGGMDIVDGRGHNLRGRARLRLDFGFGEEKGLGFLTVLMGQAKILHVGPM